MRRDFGRESVRIFRAASRTSSSRFWNLSSLAKLSVPRVLLFLFQFVRNKWYEGVNKGEASRCIFCLFVYVRCLCSYIVSDVLTLQARVLSLIKVNDVVLLSRSFQNQITLFLHPLVANYSFVSWPTEWSA